MEKLKTATEDGGMVNYVAIPKIHRGYFEGLLEKYGIFSVEADFIDGDGDPVSVFFFEADFDDQVRLGFCLDEYRLSRLDPY